MYLSLRVSSSNKISDSWTSTHCGDGPLAFFHDFHQQVKLSVCLRLWWWFAFTPAHQASQSKVKAGAQWSAHTWHLSFLLSVSFALAQRYDRLSIPLTEDTETTDNKDEAVWMARCVYRERAEGGIMKWQGENWSSALGFVLHFSLPSSLNAPYYRPQAGE